MTGREPDDVGVVVSVDCVPYVLALMLVRLHDWMPPTVVQVATLNLVGRTMVLTCRLALEVNVAGLVTARKLSRPLTRESPVVSVLPLRGASIDDRAVVAPLALLAPPLELLLASLLALLLFDRADPALDLLLPLRIISRLTVPPLVRRLPPTNGTITATVTGGARVPCNFRDDSARKSRR